MRRLIFLLLICFSSHVSGQVEIRCDRAGKLKSNMKKMDLQKITSLIIFGEFDEKDIEFIQTINSLECLDLSSAQSVCKKLENKKQIVIDTLKVPHGESLKSFGSKYFSFLPNFVTLDSVTYINNNAISNFEEVEGFPNNPNFPKIADTYVLKLNKAVAVYSFFGNTKIHTVVFSDKIRHIGRYAFQNRNIKVVEFKGNPNLNVDPLAFYMDKLELVRVEKGLKNKFTRLGFPKDIIDDGTPICRKISINQPGTLKDSITIRDIDCVDSLIISGVLCLEDIWEINKMRFLEYLDISETEILDIERKKAIENKELQMALFSMANEGQYQKDGNNLGYKFRSGIIDKVNEGIDKERRTVFPLKCTLPPNSFVNLRYLKELKLPRLLESLESMKLTDSKSDLLIYISSFSSDLISTKRLAEENKAVIHYYE